MGRWRVPKIQVQAKAATSIHTYTTDCRSHRRTHEQGIQVKSCAVPPSHQCNDVRGRLGSSNLFRLWGDTDTILMSGSTAGAKVISQVEHHLHAAERCGDLERRRSGGLGEERQCSRPLLRRRVLHRRLHRLPTAEEYSAFERSTCLWDFSQQYFMLGAGKTYKPNAGKTTALLSTVFYRLSQGVEVSEAVLTQQGAARS